MGFHDRHQPQRKLALVASAIAGLMLTGCVIGNAVDVHSVRTTTIGQELLDLETARERGFVSDEEYRETRQKILEMADQPEVHLDDLAD